MSNYEAYKPSTGAMGDRLTAMKAAFQVWDKHLAKRAFSNDSWVEMRGPSLKMVAGFVGLMLD